MDRKCQLCRLVPLKIMNLCEIIEQTPERQYITWAWQHDSVLKSEASLLDMLLNKTIIIIIIFYIWWNRLPSVEKWQDQASANVWKQSLGRIWDVESWSFLMFGWAWGSAGTIAGLQEWLVGRDERQTDGQAVLSQAPRQCAPANAQWAEQRRVGKQELKNVWVTWWEASARALCTQQCKAGQHLLSLSPDSVIFAVCFSAFSICLAPGPEQETPMSAISFCFFTVRTGACIHGLVTTLGLLSSCMLWAYVPPVTWTNLLRLTAPHW